MAKRKLKVGDPVLFYGHDLEVTEITKNDAGVQLAVVVDVAGQRTRDAAIEEIKAIRAEQAKERGARPEEEGFFRLPPGEHEKMAARVLELDAVARQAFASVKLRLDLLTFWEERGVWVSDGRILSDAQIEKLAMTFGGKPPAHAQRRALVMLEAAEA